MNTDSGTRIGPKSRDPCINRQGLSIVSNPWRDYYCKRPILCLASSKILTPHPPLRPAFVAGGGQTRRVERGVGANILEDARHSSVLYLYRILFGPTIPFSDQSNLEHNYAYLSICRFCNMNSHRVLLLWNVALACEAVLRTWSICDAVF